MVHYTTEHIDYINNIFSSPWSVAVINSFWLIRSVAEIIVVVYILIDRGLLDDTYFYYNTPATYVISNVVINSFLSICSWMLDKHDSRLEAFSFILFSGADQLALFKWHSIIRELFTWPLIKSCIYLTACVLNVVTLYPPYISKYITQEFLLTAWVSSLCIVAIRGFFSIIFGRYYLKMYDNTFSVGWIINLYPDTATLPDPSTVNDIYKPDGNPQEGDEEVYNRTFVSYVV